MTTTTHPILDEIVKKAEGDDLIGRGNAALKGAINDYFGATSSVIDLLGKMQRRLVSTINEIENGRIVDSIFRDDHRMVQEWLTKRAVLFSQICDWCWVLGIDDHALFAEIEAL